MNATAIASDSTRIIPAQKHNQIAKVQKGANGELAIIFNDGRKGEIPANEIDIQAFAIWTMLNGDCRK